MFDEDFNIETDQECPDCRKNLLLKNGRYGEFLGCPNFPDCNYAKEVPDKLLSLDGERLK